MKLQKGTYHHCGLTWVSEPHPPRRKFRPPYAYTVMPRTSATSVLRITIGSVTAQSTRIGGDRYIVDRCRPHHSNDKYNPPRQIETKPLRIAPTESQDGN